MNNSHVIRRFWDIFETHRHILFQGRSYDRHLFRESLFLLRAALKSVDKRLSLRVDHWGGFVQMVLKSRDPVHGPDLARALVKAAPELAGWDFAVDHPHKPVDDTCIPEVEFRDPLVRDQIRVRLQPFRTAGGPLGFQLWFFLPPAALEESEEILFVLPLMVGSPAYELVQFVHFEPLRESVVTNSFPFWPYKSWTCWISPHIENFWEPARIGLDEPGLTTPYCPF